MIDLHNHILYDTDDGPESIEESVRMVEEACQQGFTHLVLTPHYFPNGPYLNTAEDNREKFEMLQRVIEKTGLPITLSLGQEIMASVNIPALLDARTIQTIDGSSYLILETRRKAASAESLLSIVRRLEQKGVKTIFAHPERCDFVQDDPGILYEFARRGCLAMINYLSLNGYYGDNVERCAKEILRQNRAQLIASDAHQKEGYELLGQSKEQAMSIIDEAQWDLLTRINPEKLIHGEVIDIEAKPVKMTVSAFIAKDNLDFIWN